jgi:hypothetical protein
VAWVETASSEVAVEDRVVRLAELDIIMVAVVQVVRIKLAELVLVAVSWFGNITKS